MWQKLLYFLFKLPSMKPETTATEPRRLKRHFVMLHARVGENGQVKNQQFAQPRVGHKAVAEWRNMRWEVPVHLR